PPHTAPLEFHTLSLHDALPIFRSSAAAGSTRRRLVAVPPTAISSLGRPSGASRSLATAASRRAAISSDVGGSWLTSWAVSRADPDRKSTRLNSSHVANSYAVFC